MYSSISPPPKVPISKLHAIVPPFLVSLYDMLNNEDPRIIGWCDDGAAFGVHDCDALVKRILPMYFRHNRLASFQRQLNYFGFRKRQKMSDSDCASYYFSPHFVQHDPSRMTNIKRKTYRSKLRPPPGARTSQSHQVFSHDSSKRPIDCIMPIPFDHPLQDVFTLSGDDLELLLRLDTTAAIVQV